MAETVMLQGEAREVALAETQSVRAMVGGGERRERLDELLAAVEEGAVAGDAAEMLESMLELGMQAERIRAHYGPGGEQAALGTLRRLPRGRLRTESAREVTRALQAFSGRTLDSIGIAAVAPGAFTVTLQSEGVDVSIRLDMSGARLVSLGT
jgi:hypothetical protein